MFIVSRNVFLAAIAVSELAGVRRYLQGNATRASRTSTSTDNAAAPAIRIAGKAEAAASPATGQIRGHNDQPTVLSLARLAPGRFLRLQFSKWTRQ